MNGNQCIRQRSMKNTLHSTVRARRPLPEVCGALNVFPRFWSMEALLLGMRRSAFMTARLRRLGIRRMVTALLLRVQREWRLFCS
jgi:hypothetical protein